MYAWCSCISYLLCDSRMSKRNNQRWHAWCFYIINFVWHKNDWRETKYKDGMLVSCVLCGSRIAWNETRKDGSRMAWNERSKNALFVWLTTDLLRLLKNGGCPNLEACHLSLQNVSPEIYESKCIVSPKLINLTFLKYMSQNKVNKPYLPERYDQNVSPLQS